MPNITYIVNDDAKHPTHRTAHTIGCIAIIKCVPRSKNNKGTCWQLDHTPTGMRMAATVTKRQAQHLRRDLLALADWSTITEKGVTSELRVQVSRVIRQYPCPRYSRINFRALNDV